MREIAVQEESCAQGRTVVIEKLGSSGWYNFENVPQETHCIKVHAVRCGTDRKATNQAKRISPNHRYVIKEVRG
jgi:hypothetical protein